MGRDVWCLFGFHFSESEKQPIQLSGMILIEAKRTSMLVCLGTILKVYEITLKSFPPCWSLQLSLFGVFSLNPSLRL